MGKIIAIGGGEIGRPGYPVETTKIDKEIVRLSGKRQPRFLFIPTASSDADVYVKAVQKYFGEKLGCNVSHLLLKSEPSLKQIKSKILNSDIIYVGGGNTKKMLMVWRKLKVDKILNQAFKKGIILSGLSAGAVCWFRFVMSDARAFRNPKKIFSYMRLKGLGIIPLSASPHHIRERSRKYGIIKMMKKTPGVGIALDDFSALEIIDEKFRIITSKPHAKVYKVYKKRNGVIYKPIKKQLKFLPLSNLINKD
jgi:dipeptidase E